MTIFNTFLAGEALSPTNGEKAFFLSEKNQRKLKCPFAKIPDEILSTMGFYQAGYPVGAVIHYTAGRHGISAYDFAIEKGYTFYLIDQDGSIYQGFPLNRWGWHAGRSYHPHLGSSLSQYLVGIELTSAGLLSEVNNGVYEAWFREKIEPDKVRVVDGKYYKTAGPYESFTDLQERSLVRLLLWLKWNWPSMFNFNYVLGHDEISDHKNDPGGSLSVPTQSLRLLLKASWQSIANQGIRGT